MYCSYEEDFHHNEDYFRFTAGRFVSNEQHELAQRYVRYDINALARRAAEAVGSKSCVNIEKYPDGMSNKVLLLTMEDGNQVIAKIPNPTAGRPHFTIASEVATMDFVCELRPMYMSLFSQITGAQCSKVPCSGGLCMEFQSPG